MSDENSVSPDTPEVNEMSNHPEVEEKPTRSSSGFIIALLVLGLVATLLSYLNTNRRLARLEASLSNLETAVPNLPQATIDAIIALQNGGAPPSATTAQADGSATVSIDDDAFVGDRETAQLAIVEFSDFNCPYCQKFHQETLSLLMDKYVRTGQAIYVYRDYVGVGGNVTLAAASAAECVKELAGDQAYLELVQKLYGGSGTRNVEQVKSLAESYDIDAASLDTCISENRYQAEVVADTQAGQAAGVRGTPAFIIGQLAEDGTVTGINIPGAQPLAVFERVIDEQLAVEN
ncbi:MAG: thioredoxin domain-containing protein [Trueperaceae bacterium]|nr:thioredoxin domain-containing protein [Trueperaceae bacterium]